MVLAAVRRAQIESLRPLSNSDLPLMDLTSIHEATNSFSKENKLGEGGFGPVYRVINWIPLSKIADFVAAKLLLVACG
jgi:hypothetical protein